MPETQEGKRLKQPVAPPQISRRHPAEDEASVFWWPGTQTSAAGLELLSEPADLNLSAPSFFGSVPVSPYGYGPTDASKAADRNMRDAYATFACPVQTPAGTPEHAGRPSGSCFWGVGGWVGGLSSLALHGTGSGL